MAYDNDTCRIVGTIRKTSGAPAANETVHIVQDSIRRAWDGAALPVVQAITADGNGAVDFDLIPGHYRLVWQDATGQAQHRLYVPDAPIVWLADAAAGRESELTPEILFFGGKRGVFLDLSDQSTLFQTDDQSTPVTDVNDPIGLALDLSGNGVNMVQPVQSARGQYKTDGDVYRVQLDKIDDNYEIDFTGSGGFEATWYQPSKEGLVKGKLLIPDGVWKLARENPNFFPSNNIMGLIIVEGDVPEAMDQAIFDWWEAKGCGVDFGGTTSASSWFQNRADVRELSLKHWDTSSVTTFNAFARDCSSLMSLDVSNWDTSSVGNIRYFVYGCSSLVSLDVSNWDTSNVELSNYFVFNCSSLVTLDVSNWDTSNVKNFSSFAQGCSSLVTLDVSNWDTSNVTSFSGFMRDSGSTHQFVTDWGFLTRAIIATSYTNFCSNRSAPIDDILTAIEAAGVSSGTFTYSNGTTPSAIGEAAIDALRLRNWTVTVPGGY